MNIILFVITVIWILVISSVIWILVISSVSVYVSRKIPTESTIKKKNWFKMFFGRFATINLGGAYDFFHFYPT